MNGSAVLIGFRLITCQDRKGPTTILDWPGEGLQVVIEELRQLRTHMGFRPDTLGISLTYRVKEYDHKLEARCAVWPNVRLTDLKRKYGGNGEFS